MEVLAIPTAKGSFLAVLQVTDLIHNRHARPGIKRDRTTQQEHSCTRTRSGWPR
jgi:hypothetical protein